MKELAAHRIHCTNCNVPTIITVYVFMISCLKTPTLIGLRFPIWNRHELGSSDGPNSLGNSLFESNYKFRVPWSY
jgi:hypothetical protein